MKVMDFLQEQDQIADDTTNSFHFKGKEAHKSVLMQVGAYARDHGHVAEEGINCGIDYFVSGDEVIVTEINAR